MTEETPTLELDRPLQMGRLTLPNRVVLAPLTRNRAAEPDLAPGPLHEIYYRQRASAGLMVTEATQISPEGIGYPNTPGIHEPSQVEGWKRVTDAVHERDGRIFLQLWHVGRVSHPLFQVGRRAPVSASAVRIEKGTIHTPEGPKEYEAPRALTRPEISATVEDFARGARNAIAAGFDGVEIHGANGYLVDQFLRDGTNRREDEYGGSVENRARFLLEVTDAVVAEAGPDRTGVRLSPTSGFNAMSDSDPSSIFVHAASGLSQRDLAYLHVVESLDRTPQEERVTPALREAFDGILIVNDGYDRDSGEEALASGAADLVSYGRLFLANPDLPERFRSGAPLNDPHPATFYGGDDAGYIDYPTLPRVATLSA